MRLEHLSEDEEDHWRGEFAQENWIFGSLRLSVTLPEFAGGTPTLREMHFGYYLQPLHLNADDREDLPRKLVYVLARRRPPARLPRALRRRRSHSPLLPHRLHPRLRPAHHAAGDEEIAVEGGGVRR